MNYCQPSDFVLVYLEPGALVILRMAVDDQWSTISAWESLFQTVIEIMTTYSSNLASI